MTTIMISGHGGRWKNTEKITLPGGVSVKFFCKDGESLSMDLSWEIFNAYQKDGSSVVDHYNGEIVSPSQQVYDYMCWAMTKADGANAAKSSGIYSPIGSPQPLPDEQEARSLSEIIPTLQSPVTIYWVACRTVS